MKSSPYLKIEIDEQRDRVIRVARTAARFGGAGDVDEMVAFAREGLPRAGREGYAVLMDLRHASLPDETTYANTMRGFRREVTTGFRRVACLVETRIGFLQMQRFIREEGLHVAVFDDEGKAIAYLTQP